GKHFLFDELCKKRGKRVVFAAALVSLGVASAVLDHDGDELGNPFLGDEIVEEAGEVFIGFSEAGTVVGDQHGSLAALFVTGWDVNGNCAFVINLVGLHDQRFGIVRVHHAEFLTGNPGVESFAFLGIHHELLEASLGHALHGFRFWSGHVFRADHVIADAVDGGNGAGLAVEAFKLGGLGGVPSPGGGLWAWGPWSGGSGLAGGGLGVLGVGMRSEAEREGKQQEGGRGFHG
ncbi:MAG: hypothetical protein RLZZ399_3053, partial [Verrucomicrobiota bacterium]